MFFAADDGSHGLELWSSDGTEAGTVLVKDIRPGDYPSYPGSLTAVGGTLFFTARDGVHGQELWRSDGTGAGTSLVKDIFPDAGSSRPRELTASGGDLFLRADDGLHGEELWRIGRHRGRHDHGRRHQQGRRVLRVHPGELQRRDRHGCASRPRSRGPARSRSPRPARVGSSALEREVSGSDVVRLTLTLELTRAAKRTLRRTGQVEVGAKFTFESCGGAVRSLTRHYTVKKR